MCLIHIDFKTFPMYCDETFNETPKTLKKSRNKKTILKYVLTLCLSFLMYNNNVQYTSLKKMLKKFMPFIFVNTYGGLTNNFTKLLYLLLLVALVKLPRIRASSDPHENRSGSASDQDHRDSFLYHLLLNF